MEYVYTGSTARVCATVHECCEASRRVSDFWHAQTDHGLASGCPSARLSLLHLAGT